MPITTKAADTAIAAALRRESVAWPWAGDLEAEAGMARRIDFHGVGALLHERGLPTGWPGSLARTLRNQTIQRTMWELRHQALLAQLLGGAEKAGIQPLLMKGTALAYALYESPHLRSRSDTDLLVRPEQRSSMHRVLVAQGWRPPASTNADLASHQGTYTQDFSDGALHAIDLHWKINNSQVLSRLFSQADLVRAAVPLPRLAPQAIALSPWHALLVACMHKAVHRTQPYYIDRIAHAADERLIWFVDIDRLARQLDTDGWRRFLEEAATACLKRCAADALRRCGQLFQLAVPDFVLAGLDEAPSREAGSDYLQSSRFMRSWLDFRALESISDRARFLREVVFPERGYMRRKYGDAAGPLPWLYLRRFAAGAWRAISARAARS